MTLKLTPEQAEALAGELEGVEAEPMTPTSDALAKLDAARRRYDARRRRRYHWCAPEVSGREDAYRRALIRVGGYEVDGLRLMDGCLIAAEFEHGRAADRFDGILGACDEALERGKGELLHTGRTR